MYRGRKIKRKSCLRGACVGEVMAAAAFIAAHAHYLLRLVQLTGNRVADANGGCEVAGELGRKGRESTSAEQIVLRRLGVHEETVDGRKN